MRVFLDANVIFTAAHNPQGKSAFIIGLGDDGYFEMLTCELAVLEARRNLEMKFPKSLKQLDRLLKVFKIGPTTASGECPIELPEKDQPIFLSALRMKATHLITGDRKDFGKWMNRPKETAGVIIQTPAEFLDALG